MSDEGVERGRKIAGATRALAEDVRNTIARLTAPERAVNPGLVDLLSVMAAGLAFHQLLAEFIPKQPEADRAMLRAKILEWAENTAVGLPTSLPDAPRN